MPERIYEKGLLRVFWQSDLCTKCQLCHQELPQVFDPEKRPWVNLKAATDEEIVSQVLRCPSGALSIIQ